MFAQWEFKFEEWTVENENNPDKVVFSSILLVVSLSLHQIQI